MMAPSEVPVPHRPDPGVASLRAQRLAQLGLVANVVLAMAKLVAGLVGNSYALVADAIESSTDMLGSAVVWSGLRIARRDPDEAYPFGYGRAEALAAATVAVMMLGAAAGIAIEAVREIRTPHHAPAPWTLAVLAGVVAVKELLARLVAREARATGSVVVSADAGHHRADALTSAAAFVGIAVALLGGPGWEPADDWAALVAALVIVWNGVTLLRTAVAELMDRAPDAEVLERVAQAATGTPGVLAIHKLMVRRAGSAMHVDLHVQADPALSLRAAHDLSGAVKGAIRQRVPGVLGVLIHMEPFDGTEDA
jgi:cation diffusion facilitator family transporter